MSALFDELIDAVTSPPSLKTTQSGVHVITADFYFPAEFIGFQGHFPGNPILPGIVQIMLARYTAAQGGSGLVHCIKRCKFLQSIRPKDNVTVRVEQRGNENRYQAVISANNNLCAMLSFSLQRAL
ncbi:hypothetical protein [Erwinia sorbitola]|uniref:ApeI dehydratase-like domain-containing protein n=1 Tax=Erwinia sorbitola TaxID=2681984 RepID=A0A6I6EF10_9GAMM|nr:hypothetical protein [Erwinia sorbitola]MTD26908.1 hypothetical protein [Erwinia sorbitola]QGU88474.1 hypothetical protein GN242_15165 [Erwinia sorbitola]